MAVKIKEKVDVDLDLEGKISSKLTETKRLLLSFRKKKHFFIKKIFLGRWVHDKSKINASQHVYA